MKVVDNIVKIGQLSIQRTQPVILLTHNTRTGVIPEQSKRKIIWLEIS